MDALVHHSWIIRTAIVGFVFIGTAAAAVVPDEIVGVAATIGGGMIAWTATTLWKTGQTIARIEQRLDEHDRRIERVEDHRA